MVHLSVKEMKALQSACLLVSMKPQEEEHEEFLSDLDNQVWKEMSEERQRYLTGGSPAMWSKDVPSSAFKLSRQTPGPKLWKSKEVPATRST